MKRNLLCFSLHLLFTLSSYSSLSEALCLEDTICQVKCICSYYKAMLYTGHDDLIKVTWNKVEGD